MMGNNISASDNEQLLSNLNRVVYNQQQQSGGSISSPNPLQNLAQLQSYLVPPATSNHANSAVNGYCENFWSLFQYNFCLLPPPPPPPSNKKIVGPTYLYCGGYNNRGGIIYLYKGKESISDSLDITRIF